ncbi:FAD/NAD-P-binding domain-containing protein [Vararia minispora EC-137]|uniref:FAD/NAD-P-binding domain-containing protein n=1 Tax=Vararia minispora EC-137 TaxID=1314806 RepID=A0ACB8QD11_9AGAM|nr:FAD/NAD-P-binding domain-containing protein [Vararia minispora EC-137]
MQTSLGKLSNIVDDASPPVPTRPLVDLAFETGNFSVDYCRPMKVICVGAGISGILAGIRFRQKIPNLDLTIYEKEKGVGGTWLGLACDLPSHAYQYSFEPNTQWSNFYAPGPEILQYLEGVVDKYKLKKYIRLHHELIHAIWDATTAKWHVRIKRHNPADGEAAEFEDTADVLFLGVGLLSRWRWPDIEGLKDFKGTIVHSAQWNLSEGSWEDDVRDWANKNIGVIGNGSTGIQIVATLQPRVGHLTNFARNKTWLSTSFSSAKLLELLNRSPDSTDYSFDAKTKEMLSDPAYYNAFRIAIESDANSVSSVALKGSALQKRATEFFRAQMLEKLSRKPELAVLMIPDFSVACRRITPGPGYLEALCEPNVTLEPTPIKRVTSNGVDLDDGRHTPLDVLICATGFDTSFRYPFDIVGRGGMLLRDRWASHAEAYLAMTVDGFPNLFFSAGPHTGLNSGSGFVMIERQVEFATTAIAKLQRERYRAMEPTAEAVRDFMEYANSFFKKTVYVEGCHNWYRSADGWVSGLWPGSCLHACRTMGNPRWEDFTFEPLDKTRNRFYWLGDGQTENEKIEGADRAWYLNSIDVPPVPTD